MQISLEVRVIALLLLALFALVAVPLCRQSIRSIAPDPRHARPQTDNQREGERTRLDRRADILLTRNQRHLEKVGEAIVRPLAEWDRALEILDYPAAQSALDNLRDTLPNDAARAREAVDTLVAFTDAEERAFAAYEAARVVVGFRALQDAVRRVRSHLTKREEEASVVINRADLLPALRDALEIEEQVARYLDEISEAAYDLELARTRARLSAAHPIHREGRRAATDLRATVAEIAAEADRLVRIGELDAAADLLTRWERAVRRVPTIAEPLRSRMAAVGAALEADTGEPDVATDLDRRDRDATASRLRRLAADVRAPLRALLRSRDEEMHDQITSEYARAFDAAPEAATELDADLLQVVSEVWDARAEALVDRVEGYRVEPTPRPVLGAYVAVIGRLVDAQRYDLADAVLRAFVTRATPTERGVARDLSRRLRARFAHLAAHGQVDATADRLRLWDRAGDRYRIDPPADADGPPSLDEGPLGPLRTEVHGEPVVWRVDRGDATLMLAGGGEEAAFDSITAGVELSGPELELTLALHTTSHGSGGFRVRLSVDADDPNTLTLRTLFRRRGATSIAAEATTHTLAPAGIRRPIEVSLAVGTEAGFTVLLGREPVREVALPAGLDLASVAGPALMRLKGRGTAALHTVTLSSSGEAGRPLAWPRLLPQRARTVRTTPIAAAARALAEALTSHQEEAIAAGLPILAREIAADKALWMSLADATDAFAAPPQAPGTRSSSDPPSRSAGVVLADLHETQPELARAVRAGLRITPRASGEAAGS